VFTHSRRIRSELVQHRDLLYRIAYAWCHSPALADDLVQETLEKGLRNARQLKNPAAIKSWLGRILANCWYDYLRRNRETVDLENLSWEKQATADDGHETADIVQRVRAMITGLPMGQRQVITLVDLAGFSYVEVADILDIPIGTVMSRINRARNALKLKLADYDPRQQILREHIRRVK
jgi:RNA polymerase sigma-70 factor (ECF subfamily)